MKIIIKNLLKHLIINNPTPNFHIIFFNFVSAQMKLLLILIISPILLAQTILEDPSESPEYNLFKGWLRFFTFVPDFTTTVRPTKFEYNPAFIAQEKLHITCDMEKKDEWGTFDIPSETSFFFVLTKKSLYVVSARRVW